MIRQYTGIQWVTYGLHRGYDIYLPQNRIYCAPAKMLRTVGPRWFIALLRFRDATLRSWAQHCFDMGLVREGHECPHPRWAWLYYGW